MKKKNILITGCSSGIGLDCALQFAKLGHRVFATIRKKSDESHFRNSENIIPVELDVLKPETVEKAFKLVSNQVGSEGLQGLVNNAGIVVSGPLECLPLESFRNQFEVNLSGPLLVIQKFLPLIRKGQGRIVNVGSISGHMAAPFIGPYAASKSALKTLTDSLRYELIPWNIPVALIEPGPIKTPIWDRSKKSAQNLLKNMAPEVLNLYKPYLEKFQVLVDKSEESGDPVSKVTRAVEHALFARYPNKRYLVGTLAKVQAWMARYFPLGLRDKVVAKTVGLTASK